MPRLLLPRQFRGLPPIYWAIWGGTLLDRLGAFVVPMLTFYLTQERKLPLVQAAAVVSAFGAGQVVASLVGGSLTDHLGRRVTLLFSLCARAFCLVALGEARGVATIALATFSLGFCGDLGRPAQFALVADTVRPGDRARAYGLLHVAVNIGFSVAPALAGWLAGVSYRWLFWGDAATSLLYAGVVGLFVRETLGEARAEQGEKPRTDLKMVLGDRTFLAFVALMFVSCLLPFQSYVTLSVWMAEQGHSAATYGTVVAANGLLIVLVQPWILEWLGRRDTVRLLATSVLLTGFGFSLHGLGASLWLHLLAVGFWTFGEMFVNPSSGAVVASLAPPDARGRYQGLFTMSWGMASFAAPLLSLPLLERFGQGFWAGCLGLGVVVAAGILLWGPAYRRRMATG